MNPLEARIKRLEILYAEIIRRLEALEKLAQRDTQRFATTPFELK